MLTKDKLMDDILNDVRFEVERATYIHGPFNSAHEGYAVFLEESDELWQEIKHGKKELARGEAIQAAAMLVRLIMDCYNVDKN